MFPFGPALDYQWLPYQHLHPWNGNGFLTNILIEAPFITSLAFIGSLFLKHTRSDIFLCVIAVYSMETLSLLSVWTIYVFLCIVHKPQRLSWKDHLTSPSLASVTPLDSFFRVLHVFLYCIFISLYYILYYNTIYFITCAYIIIITQLQFFSQSLQKNLNS